MDIACDLCFVKKIKCDMLKPTCSDCQIDKADCRTTVARRRVRPTRAPQTQAAQASAIPAPLLAATQDECVAPLSAHNTVQVMLTRKDRAGLKASRIAWHASRSGWIGSAGQPLSIILARLTSYHPRYRSHRFWPAYASHHRPTPSYAPNQPPFGLPWLIEEQLTDTISQVSGTDEVLNREPYPPSRR